MTGVQTCALPISNPKRLHILELVMVIAAEVMMCVTELNLEIVEKVMVLFVEAVSPMSELEEEIVVLGVWRFYDKENW